MAALLYEFTLIYGKSRSKAIKENSRRDNLTNCNWQLLKLTLLQNRKEVPPQNIITENTRHHKRLHKWVWSCFCQHKVLRFQSNFNL